jgi:hypothetical protein
MVREACVLDDAEAVFEAVFEAVYEDDDNCDDGTVEKEQRPILCRRTTTVTLLRNADASCDRDGS